MPAPRRRDGRQRRLPALRESGFAPNRHEHTLVMFRRCALLLLATWAGLTSFVAAAEAPAPVKALETRDAAIEA